MGPSVPLFTLKDICLSSKTENAGDVACVGAMLDPFGHDGSPWCLLLLLLLFV
jgi:hypothetical protein